MLRYGVSTSVDPTLSAIYFAEVGTEVPEKEELGPDFQNAGLIQEDGFSIAYNYEEGEAINAWPATEVGRGASTRSPEFSFGFLGVADINKLRLAYHEDDISGTEEDFTVSDTARDPSTKVVVIDTLLEATSGERVRQRRVIPQAAFAGREDEDFDGESADAISLTLRCERGEDGVYSRTHTWKEGVGDGSGGGEGN